tara:strand:- start:765 stop:1472 length:708 start_codon:yes stop_codon:yes gene_type:complete
MWDLFYYLAGISAVGTVGFGVLYFYDRDTADEISREIGWNAVKAYHKINLEYDNLKRWYDQQNRPRISRSDDEEENDDFEDVKEVEFIGYNSKDDTTYKTTDLEENEYIEGTYFELMFMKTLGDEQLYKRITDKNEVDQNVKIEKIDKPFIQVELCQNEEKTSIHQQLVNFYVEENKLLDKAFLNWYLRTFYSIILNDDYHLSIIDSDINMFKIGKDECITLNPNKKYEVKSSQE